jgi:hypothetical protein
MGPDNLMDQTINLVSEISVSPSHEVVSKKEIAFYRDEDCSSTDTGFADSSNREDLPHIA